MNTEFDVLVVGGGLAAISAARWALEGGVRVALVTRGWLGSIGVRGSGASSCGTTEYGKPSISRLVGSGSFDPDKFSQMIINAGLGLVSRGKVQLFVDELLKFQPQAKEINNLYHQPGPYTLGTPLIHHYLAQIRDKITIIPNTTVARLFVKDDICGGVLCIDEKSGESFTLQAKAVILAAGGNAGLFSTHVHPECVTGDGYILGLMAGETLTNLEFMQIFSMTTAPNRNLIHFWKPEYLEIIKNAEGEEFVEKYLPPGITLEQCLHENVMHAPFSVRDRASRYLGVSIAKEVQSGRGTPSGGVFVDLRSSPSFMSSRQYRFLKYKGIDAAKAPLEIGMGFQCCNGGLKVDDRMAAATLGLYAAGENAGGFHGADRLGGNMLSGCVISGKLAGQAAASYSKKTTHPAFTQVRQDQLGIVSLLGTRSQVPPELRNTYHRMIYDIREVAQHHMLLIKNKKGLEQAQKRLDEIEEKAAAAAAGTHGQIPIELGNMLLLSRSLLLATSSREESRGGFYREDFPEMDAKAKPKISRISLNQDGKIALTSEVVDPEWDLDFQNTLSDERWG